MVSVQTGSHIFSKNHVTLILHIVYSDIWHEHDIAVIQIQSIQYTFYSIQIKFKIKCLKIMLASAVGVLSADKEKSPFAVEIKSL